MKKIILCLLMCFLCGALGNTLNAQGTDIVSGSCDYTRLRRPTPFPTSWSKSLGVYQLNVTPISQLEVNSNISHHPATCIPRSDVFSTDAGDVMSNWVMRQFTAEIGRIYGDNTDFHVQAQQQLWLRTSAGIPRVLVDNVTSNGSVAMGDNLPSGFIPQSRLHINMNGAAPSDMRFTNLNTPLGGFRIGVNPLGNNAGVFFLDDGELSFGTNNIRHGFFDDNASTAGSFAIGDNLGVGFAPQSRLHVHMSISAPSDMRFTNASTVAGGLRIGVNPFATDAGVFMLENARLNFGTNNINRIRILENGRTVVSPNAAFFTVLGNRFVIEADASDATPSGLQFLGLTCVGPTVANPGLGVLSVDCSGNVIYVPGGGVGAITGADNGCSVAGTNVELGGNIGSGLGVLTNDREVYMDVNSVMFNAAPSGAASIGLGRPFGTLPISNKARLDVFNDYNLYFSAGDFTTIQSNSSEVFGSRSTALNSGTGNSTGVLGIGGGTSTPSGTSTGVRGHSVGASDINIGVHGEANNGNVESTAGLYQVLGSGSVTNTGIKSDVSGGTNASIAAISIAGDFMVSSNASASIAVRGICSTATGGVGPDWAGQFLGDLYGSGTFQPSDRNLKRDINPIENSLEIIQKLKPVNYFFDTDRHANMGLATTKQWGFISQEVQEILPELTKQTTIAPVYDSDGKEMVKQTDVLTLNYNGFIAILTDAIQEQQKQINELKEMIGMMQPTNDVNPNINSQDVELSDKEYVVLNQNVPNPFAEQTTISYVIPETANDAQIIFYNALGKMIKNVVINDKGEGRLNVYADDLSSGVYSYSLFVDSKLIDTKKMVKQ